MAALASPDLLNMKKLATSQSAPSYSPIRRRLESESPENSPEEEEPDEVEAATGDAQAQEAELPEDQAMEADPDEGEEDDDVSEDPAANNVGSIVPFVSGVSVLQPAHGSSEEEEDEGQPNYAIAVASTEGLTASSIYPQENQAIATQAICDMSASPPNLGMQDASDEEEEEEEETEKVMDHQEEATGTTQNKNSKRQKTGDIASQSNDVSSIFAQSAQLADSFFAEPATESKRSPKGLEKPSSAKGGLARKKNEEEELGEDDVDVTKPVVPKSSEQAKGKSSKRQKVNKDQSADTSHKQVDKKNGKNDVSSQSSSPQLGEPSSASRIEEPIVPAESQSATQLVLPSTGSGESWGVLPPEANSPWSVQKDSCSLEVGGHLLKLPRSVFDRLFFYQRQGVAWMWNLFQKGFGGILADEMGLGKTVQVAAFLSCLKFSNQGSRFLVIVPPTLLEQWRREMKSWSSDTGLAVHVMHGTAQERRSAIRGLLCRGGVMLTSYELARNAVDCLKNPNATNIPKKRKKQTKRGCRDDDSPSEEEEEEVPSQNANQEGPWDTVIVDEGHQIKNPSCLVGRALRKIDARSRFLLTGTPLQNKLSDLWALMDFAQPGLLGNHATFERTFSEQIEKGSKRNATAFAVELKDHLARELKRLTAPHFLRRLKDEVQLTGNAPPETGAGVAPENLPPKTDVVLWLNLTNAQIELYNLFLGSETVRRATAGKNGMEALKAIAMLKKLCNNPLLCLPKEEFGEWRQRIVPSTSASKAQAPQKPAASGAPAIAPDQEDAFDDDATQPAVEDQDFLARLRAMMPGSAEGAALLSCKLKVLAVLLPQLQKRGHRCLIFSHSTRMLDLIQACVLRVLGLKFLRIDGTIDPKDRDVKVTKFQAPDSRYFCMCLSSQVGGVGLTITGADRVILADPAWNPAMDAQAIDRVHRLGQTRDVVVYRLVGSGAIEDKMFRLQVFKRSLAKTAMEQESQIRFFTNKELKQLFEAPNLTTSTQALMSEQLGVDALEHEGLLNVVANDIGSTDDADAMPFWQSSDVLGFSDYQRLFMYLEQTQKAEEEVEKKAKDFVQKLKTEEYKADQVIEGKWRSTASKENISPQEQGSAPLTNE